MKCGDCILGMQSVKSALKSIYLKNDFESKKQKQIILSSIAIIDNQSQTLKNRSLIVKLVSFYEEDSDNIPLLHTIVNNRVNFNNEIETVLPFAKTISKNA